MKFMMGALALALGITLLAAPAQATTCHLGFCYAGYVNHSPDTGYDKPLIILCGLHDTWEDRKYVREGESSIDKCPGRYDDMNWVWVRGGEEWWCEDANSTRFSKKELTYDLRGKHWVEDKDQDQCVVKRD
jgi:hypothetical protein